MKKNILRAAVSVAGIVLAMGCDDSKAKEVRDQRADLARTQAKANEKIAEIRADESRDKANIAAKAGENVAAQKKDVAEERRDVAKAENDLYKENRKDAVDALAAGTVSGTLQSTLGSQLTIRDTAGVDHKFDVKDSTRVTYNGQSVHLDDYKAGTEVRASFINDGHDKIAKDVLILNPALRK